MLALLGQRTDAAAVQLMLGQVSLQQVCVVLFVGTHFTNTHFHIKEAATFRDG